MHYIYIYIFTPDLKTLTLKFKIMGFFSKSKTKFSDDWDTSIPPTFDGEDLYATNYGSSTFVCTIPNSSGISRAVWKSDDYGNRIIVVCKDYKSYVVYENCVEEIK